MIGSILQTDLEEIIKSKNWADLRDAVCGLDPPDIAEVLSDIPPQDEGVIEAPFGRRRHAFWHS